MKTLLTHLTRFAAFTAVTLAILFGLPALAERHPFILLAVSIAIFDSGRVCHSQTSGKTQSGKAPHRHPPQGGMTSHHPIMNIMNILTQNKRLSHSG